jgi:hypothetical protein
MDVLALGFGILFFVMGITGLFGVSGGLAFWFLWRYWFLSKSSAGKPPSTLLEVEG